MSVATVSSGPGSKLAVIPRDSFFALADGSSEIREAMESVGGEKFGPNDLTRVKMPTGGSTTWEIADGVGGVDHSPNITGALCFVQKAGVLWGEFEPKPGAMPVLRSHDLVIGEQVGPLPDHMGDTLEKCRVPGTENRFFWDEERNPYNRFGSGKNGQGKRCREQRLLFILRRGDIYPLCVAVQPGSLNNWRRFFLNLPKLGIVYWRAVVELGLEKAVNPAGQTYARIVPKLVGQLSVEDGELIRTQYQTTLQRVAPVVAEQEGEIEGDDA